MKELFYHFKEPDKPCVLLWGPTGISAVNIGGTRIHSGFVVKPGVKWLSFSEKMCFTAVKFVGLEVALVAGLIQLPPIMIMPVNAIA